MTFSNPAALWLLAAVPLVWLAHLVARTNFNSRQRALQAALRSLLLATVALALARPAVSITSTRESIVYLVDVSHSVSGSAIDEAARRIDELNAALRPAHSQVVAFGRTAAALTNTDALRALAPPEVHSSGGHRIDRSGTDLEDALAAARAELAPAHVPRLVLFTDGQETAGDTTAAVARYAAAGIPISVQPLAARALGDTWVESIELPESIVAGTTFQATVVVGSQKAGTADVELRSASGVLGRRAVSVKPGTTTVPIDVVLPDPGAASLEAEVRFPGDPLAANNTFHASVWTSPHPKVLYVEGVPASARYLSQALRASGYDVTLRPPSALPSAAADLDPWDVVILSDVSRAAIKDGAMSALSGWVERRGGGLLVAGGESVFGEGGYRKSPLERLTPVTFERKDEPEVALVLVLDRSWSMAGPSMELCKAAAQAAVDVMTNEQSVGILTFNDGFNWDVPLRKVGGNRDGIRERIAAIGPGGHTLIYPAVEQAYNALRTAKARAKHVVLLSDGRSYPANYEDLVGRMAEARITVSSIAVGPAADPELLGNIAKWGRGRAYAVSDARELPQIFVKEAKNAATPAFDERPIAPVVTAPAFFPGLDLRGIPQLKGRTATVIKETALQVVSTEDDDPLLAFWPIGAGRVAVFASDVKDRWAANWVKWRGYGPFFTTVVRAIERRRSPAVALEVTPGPIRRRSRSLAVAVEARDAAGQYRDLLRPVVQVRTPGAPPTDVPLRQVAPGRYEARVIGDATQPFTFTVADSDGTTSRTIRPDAAAEYRFRPPDRPLLESIASATGGAWLPATPALPNRNESRAERRPLAPALILIALVLWLLDLLMRRIRVLEPSVSHAGPEVKFADGPRLV